MNDTAMQAAKFQHDWAENWLEQRKNDNKNAKRDNGEKGICASENGVIAAMLARENSQNMLPVYSDIAKHLPDGEHRILALSAVLDGLVLASEKQTKEVADAKEEAHALNWDAYWHFDALQQIFQRQKEIAWEHGVSPGDTGGITEWIEAALNVSDTETEIQGKSRIMPALEAIGYKYWPDPAAFFAGLCDIYYGRVLASEPKCVNSPLDKSTQGYRVPLRDALRVMLTRIDVLPGNRRTDGDSFTDMPKFQLSTTSLTNLLVTIGFHPDVADENTVKQARKELIRQG